MHIQPRNFVPIVSSICFFLLMQSSVIFSQPSVIDCEQTIHSEILHRDMHFCIYLPASYQSSKRSYPVLYLMHGMWGNHTDWVNAGELGHTADKLIQTGAIPEMIVVMPDGLTDAFYINNFDGSIEWEDFFYQEFIPSIEKSYRIVTNRNNRGIAGLSMGGYGALYHSLKHKDMFSACYALSAAVIELEPETKESKLNEYQKAFNEKLWGPLNEEGFPENYQRHSVQEMVKGMAPYEPSKGFWSATPVIPAITLDCGDDDMLLEFNSHLVELLKEKQIPVEWRVRDGGHTWDYWRSGLKKVLVFTGKSFRK